MTWLALASVVIGGVWWMLTPSSPGKGAQAPRAWSRRWWRDRALYVVGFFFVFFGLSQLQQQIGWVAGLGLGLGVAIATMALTRLVVRLVRRRRASRP